MIEAIKSAVSLKMVLVEAGVILNRGKAHCPLHADRSPSFSVKGDRWICFGCGERGDQIDLFAKIHGLDFKGAFRLLADRAGIKTGRQTPSEARKFAEAVKDRARKAELIKAFRQWERGKVDELSKTLRAFNRLKANLPGLLSEVELQTLAERQAEINKLEYHYGILCVRDDSEKFEFFKQDFGI